MDKINSIDFINDLELKSKRYISLADVLLLLCKRVNCEVSVAAEILLSRIHIEKDANPTYFGQKIGMATFRQSTTDALLYTMLENAITGQPGTFEDNPFDDQYFSEKYWSHSFVLEDLEQAASFKLGNLSQEVPDYLKPYEIRFTIQLTEVANILSGCKPRDNVNSGHIVDIINGYKDALWEAYDHGVLSGSNVVTDYHFNDEYRTDVTLIRDEVTDWTKQHGLKWPFKKLNSQHVEDKDSIIDSLNKKIKQLQVQLSTAQEMIPIMLNQYRDDDPLAIAISLRKNEWLGFNEDEARSSTPSVEYLVAKLKSEYGMSGALAGAIEKVACPIPRKGA